MTPDDLPARVTAIEERLERLESLGPTWAELSKAVVRIADHLAPEAVNIVGSTYLAGRLGCTTTWVGRMASNGKIPRGCIVAGTGRGKLWKFYRQRVDDWLASGSPEK